MTLELPTEEQLARIYEELGMNPETIERDVAYLKEWIFKQPHLPKDIDDRLLRNSLIFRKNSLEKVKQCVDQFYSAKSLVPELMSNRDPEDPALQGEMENLFCYPLPKLTPDGSRVMIFKLFCSDPKLFHYPSAAKLVLMVAALSLLEDRCLTHTIVFDLQGITMSHLATVQVPLARKFLYIGQKAYPIRQNAVHIIYAPSYIETMLSIFKPFLQKKLIDRIHIHSGGLGSIFDVLPRSIFPVDYGGEEISLRDIQIFLPRGALIHVIKCLARTLSGFKQTGLVPVFGYSTALDDAEPILNSYLGVSLHPVFAKGKDNGGIREKWRTKLVEYRGWFLEDDKKAVDERKRPGKPRTHYDMFGFEGSFRQLSVD